MYWFDDQKLTEIASKTLIQIFQDKLHALHRVEQWAYYHRSQNAVSFEQFLRYQIGDDWMQAFFDAANADASIVRTHITDPNDLCLLKQYFESLLNIAETQNQAFLERHQDLIQYYQNELLRNGLSYQPTKQTNQAGYHAVLHYSAPEHEDLYVFALKLCDSTKDMRFGRVYELGVYNPYENEFSDSFLDVRNQQRRFQHTADWMQQVLVRSHEAAKDYAEHLGYSNEQFQMIFPKP